MNKVLVIAYYFPPLGLSGVQRTLKFVKYLPQFGWQPTVITVSSTGYFAKDESLLRELEGLHIKVIRVGSFDMNRFFSKNGTVKMPAERVRKILSRISDTFFIPDNKIGWKRAVIKEAAKILSKEKFQAIFATAPPQTDFLIGKALKEKFKIPLIIDYRDAWVDYPFKFFPTPLHKYLHYRLEKKLLRGSDGIITASRNVKELILKRYKFLTYNDVKIISQGFDPEDMKVEHEGMLPHTEKMRITYAGVFYEDRTPEYFLEALHLVLKENPKLRGRIEACFVGAFRSEYIDIVNKLGLQNAVNILGYLEHKECVRYLLASDIAWVMMGDDRSSPGKIFEYIGVQKKILGCVPEGNMRAIIEEAGGVCVAPRDIRKIADEILRLYEQYERRELRGPRPEVVDKYNRVTLTGELAKTLTQFLEVQ